MALTGTTAMRTGEILDPFHSPPVQGLLLLPLTILPVTAAYLLFSLGSLMAILIAVALPLRVAPGELPLPCRCWPSHRWRIRYCLVR